MPDPSLSPLQQRLLRRFFELPATDGFALAGGAALILTGDVDRTTRDVDLFTPDGAPLGSLVEEVAAHLQTDGLAVDVLRSGPTFARLIVRDGIDEVEMDLARDFRWRPTRDTAIGPVLHPEELAADKVLALFGRAEARDFVDFFALSRRYPVEDMLAWAAEKDRGFDRYVFAEMLGRFELRRRSDFAVDDETHVRIGQFVADLRARLVDSIC